MDVIFFSRSISNKKNLFISWNRAEKKTKFRRKSRRRLARHVKNLKIYFESVNNKTIGG